MVHSTAPSSDLRRSQLKGESFMSSIDESLSALGITPVGTEVFEPFSRKEIATLEEMAGVQLPDVYKRFVTTYGKSMFSTGTDAGHSENPVAYCCFFGFGETVNGRRFSQRGFT